MSEEFSVWAIVEVMGHQIVAGERKDRPSRLSGALVPGATEEGSMNLLDVSKWSLR
jgi:hypothetical protein